MAPLVQAAGHTAEPIGPERAASKPERTALRPPDPAREERDLRERFVRRAARDRVPWLRACLDRLAPDVVVCDQTDFGGLLAAEIAGLPFATVEVIAAGDFVRPDVVAGELDALRAELGLPPDPGLTMPARFLLLVPAPPSFRDPAHPLPATAHPIRPGAAVPPRREREDRPVVYFTLGTVFHLESGDLVQRVTRALAELDIELWVSVGDEVDPEELGPQPEHVHVVRFLPQGEILPRCDLVVCHGGSGSVLGALAHGVPLVLLPLGADQPNNARRCEALGVARVLDPTAVDAEGLRSAVSSSRADDGLRRRATGMAHEIAALPDASYAVRLLERLAKEARPILRAPEPDPTADG